MLLCGEAAPGGVSPQPHASSSCHDVTQPNGLSPLKPRDFMKGQTVSSALALKSSCSQLWFGGSTSPSLYLRLGVQAITQMQTSTTQLISAETV